MSDNNQSDIFYELYECWHERVKCKKYTKEAYDFERNIGKKLTQISKRIVDRSWAPDGYFEFPVYHPSRIISAPFYHDRIVEHWLTEKYVKPFAEPKLHPFNIACREKMGPPVAMSIIKNTIKEMYGKYGNDFYFLQCDIKGYFDNVCHERIAEIFSGMEELGYVLFMNIVKEYEIKDCYAANKYPNLKFGVPKGNLPSQWIGIMYLNELDWIFSKREDCESYVRYMDDFIMFFHTKKSCKDCKIKIEKYLEEKMLGVRLHPKKTVYAPISRGFTFCGWHYSLDDKGGIKTTLKQERKYVIKKRYRQMVEDYYVGKLSDGDVQAKIAGTNAFIKMGDTKKFKRYIQNRFRFTHEKEEFYKNRNTGGNEKDESKK